MDATHQSPIESLERRVRRLLATDSSREDRLQDLQVLEIDLWRAILASAPPPRAGHPLLPVARRWRARLIERGLHGAREQLSTRLDLLHERRLGRWRKACRAEVLGDDPATWLEELRETDRLHRASLEPDRGIRAGGEELEQTREFLHAGFEERLAQSPFTEEQRRAWVESLVEAVDAAMSEAEELPSEESAHRLAVLAGEVHWFHGVLERGGVSKDDDDRRRLRSRRRRLRAESIERRLSARLDGLFGARLAALWERGILAAILVVLGLLAAPMVFDLSAAQERTLLLVDGLLCAFFLVDFGVKWTLTRFSPNWFKRHFITDLLPALPFSLVVLASDPSSAAGGWMALRVFRLSQSVRTMRLLLPFLRALRAVTFLLRGLDGIVRRHGRALDFQVILHPTPHERRRARRRARSPLASLWRLLHRVEGAWGRALEDSRQPEEVAAYRLPALDAAAEVEWRAPRGSLGAVQKDPISADELLEQLGSIEPEEVEGELGPDLVRCLARGARAIAGSPLRWLPLIRSYVPRAPDGVEDADLVARLARGAATRFSAQLNRLRWGADLYGTMTPSDLVGQLGAALVKRTSRPVVRVLMLGAALLAIQGTFNLFELDEIESGFVGQMSAWSQTITGLLGTTLLLIAGVCLLLLVLGVWLQRIASDASAHYTQVASAQFLHLTEAIKVRSLEEDAALFDARVFRPEAELREGPTGGREEFLTGIRGWLTEGRPVERKGGGRGFDPVARTVLLYRDVLDGALLAESDTRTTSQLLGNLALKRIRGRSWRVGAGDDRALAKLDLVHRRSLIGGPWMWFNLIARATTQQVARLIVDYNENAIPLDELGHASTEVEQRYREWIEHRRTGETSLQGKAHRGQMTTAFTALHFLDDAPERDEGIRVRFGEDVLELVRSDRRALFRRVFGAYPLHLRPPEHRTLNPRRVYRRWIEGGRVLILPLRVAKRGVKQMGRGAGLCFQAVKSVRGGAHGKVAPVAETDFVVAARKIDRMRGPAARACTWQRVLADVEYLGLDLPGSVKPHQCTGRTETNGSGDIGLAERDLEFLAVDPKFRERVDLERQRAQGDVARLELELSRDLWTRLSERAGVEFPRTGERIRALVVAYRADYHGARSHLSAFELCAEVLLPASQQPSLPPRILPRWFLRRAFRAWWTQFGRGGRRERMRAWRAAEHDVEGVASALLAWHRVGVEEGRRKGEEALLEVMRHPGQITEQVVTLRVVQTLALIDLRHYRRQVWRMGRYAEEGDEPGRRLSVPQDGFPT